MMTFNSHGSDRVEEHRATAATMASSVERVSTASTCSRIVQNLVKLSTEPDTAANIFCFKFEVRPSHPPTARRRNKMRKVGLRQEP